MANRNLHRRLWRTILTILGISLGVAVVLAINMTNRSTIDSLEGVFDRTVGAAELLVISTGEGETIDGQLVSVVQSAPGVQIASPNLTFRTVLANDTQGSETRFVAGGVQIGQRLEIRGVDLEQDSQIRVYPLASGRFPEGSRYEALTTQQYSKEKGLEIGDDLEILTPLGIEHLEIVGLLGEEGAGLLNDGSVAFVPLDVAQEIFDLGDQVHEISIRVETGIRRNAKELENLKVLLDERVGNDARATYPVARGELVPRMLDSYQTGLFFFSIVAMFVGSFLIYNTFSMTIVERTREIGMLRAIGMEQGQVLRLVLVEAGMLSVLGGILGVVLGRFLARGLSYLLNGFISVDESLLVVSNADLLKSIGIGFIITFLAALIPAFQAARTSPVEALQARSRSPQRIRSAVWLSGLAFLFAGWAALYGLQWRSEVLFQASTAGFILLMLGSVLTIPSLLATLERGTRPLVAFLYRSEGTIGSSNVSRSVLRTTLTVACLMVAMVMIIAIGSLSQIFKKDISDWVNSALGSDLYVRPAETLHSTFSSRLLGVPGVKTVSASRRMQVKIAQSSFSPGDGRQDTLLFLAIEPASFRQVGDMVFVDGQGDPEEKWEKFSEGESLFVSSVVADEYGLEQGDLLNLQTRRGEHPFEVAAIISDFSGQGLVVTGTYVDLKRWFSESGADRFSILLESNADIDVVAQEIKNRYGDRYNLEITTTKTVKESVLRMLDQAFLLFDILSMIAVVIGGLGVLNTLMMNVSERTREIGGLRSMGMTRSQVVRMVLAESLAIGLIGCVYGEFFGYAMSRIFVASSTTITSYELEYSFTPSPFIMALLIALGVSQIAAFVPARKAAFTNLIEALKHE
jgi:putative ABC transport system permease protein